MPVDATAYPTNLLVEGRRVVVVGGGGVAAGKAEELLRCGADVVLVAPRIGDGVRALEAAPPAGSLTVRVEAYDPAVLEGAWLVVTATDDPAVNGAVAADAEARRLWCNSADDTRNCSFTLPSRIRQGPLLVTFSTGGHSPALTRWLRETYTEEFGPEYVTLIELLAAERARILAEGRTTMGLAWREALDSGMLESIRGGRLAEAKERLQACLSSSSV